MMTILRPLFVCRSACGWITKWSMIERAIECWVDDELMSLLIAAELVQRYFVTKMCLQKLADVFLVRLNFCS